MSMQQLCVWWAHVQLLIDSVRSNFPCLMAAVAQFSKELFVWGIISKKVEERQSWVSIYARLLNVQNQLLKPCNRWRTSFLGVDTLKHWAKHDSTRVIDHRINWRINLETSTNPSYSFNNRLRSLGITLAWQWELFSPVVSYFLAMSTQGPFECYLIYDW